MNRKGVQPTPRRPTPLWDTNIGDIVMKLCGGTTYRVWTVWKIRGKRTVMPFTLTYAGGGCVDSDGHHVGSGIWMHVQDDRRSGYTPRPGCLRWQRQHFEWLNVAGMVELKHRYWEGIVKFGGWDPDRVVMTLADMTDAWLIRTYKRKKKQGRIDQLPTLTAELVRRGLDVVDWYGN